MIELIIPATRFLDIKLQLSFFLAASLMTCMLLTTNNTFADSVIVDYNMALRGVQFNPEDLDINGEDSAIGNGMPDAVELALVAAVLADPAIDFSNQNGVSHNQVYAAYLQAQQSAKSDLNSLTETWATSIDVGIGYALLGTTSRTKLSAMTDSFGAPMGGDYSLAAVAGEYLSANGDADGDGFSNYAEFIAFGKSSTEAYVNAALDSSIQPETNQLASSVGSVKTLGIVLYPGFEVLDVYGPLEMWAYVPDFKIVMIAEEVGPVMSAQGVATFATHSFKTAPQLDILMVPGGTGSREQLNNETFLDYIDVANETTQYTTSVCTGSALLAKAGILNGHRATTNKRFFFLAEEQSKEVDWVVDARWVESGKMFTSSGVSAGTDMALGLIAKIHGQEAARELASSVEYEWHEEASSDPFSQFVNKLEAPIAGPGQLVRSQPAAGESLSEAPRWMRLFFSKLPNVDASQITLRKTGAVSEQISLRGMHNMGANDLMIEIAQPIGPGSYEVSWSASFDGEQNSPNDSYQFTVE